MPKRQHPVRTCLPVLILLGVAATHAAPQAPPVPAPLDLVPVNVHVIDRAGKPVTDL